VCPPKLLLGYDDGRAWIKVYYKSKVHVLQWSRVLIEGVCREETKRIIRLKMGLLGSQASSGKNPINYE
jgi:hypothetical protein